MVFGLAGESLLQWRPPSEKLNQTPSQERYLILVQEELLCTMPTKQVKQLAELPPALTLASL